MSMKLKINGKEKEFDGDGRPKTLLELINHLGINEAAVVAEIDGEIIERKKFASTSVMPGQSIELVRFVGGG